jgi:hypothetical protein
MMTSRPPPWRKSINHHPECSLGSQDMRGVPEEAVIGAMEPARAGGLMRWRDVLA